MSLKWCAGTAGNGYDGHHGHWWDPRGVEADKPPSNCICTPQGAVDAVRAFENGDRT